MEINFSEEEKKEILVFFKYIRSYGSDIANADISFYGNSLDYWDNSIYSGLGKKIKLYPSIEKVINNLVDQIDLNDVEFSGDDDRARVDITFDSSEKKITINVIEYVTISTTGNSISFGNLTVSRRTRACSNATRGIFCGGYSPTYNSTIDFIAIASLGNATNFGSMNVTSDSNGACSSSTRGLFMGGDAPGGATNRIEYVTIATTGNGVNFGTLTQNAAQVVGLSNGHGGL